MDTCIKNRYGNCSNRPELYPDNEGNKYCIFHAPLELRRKYGAATLFNDLISKRPLDDVDYSGYEFDNDMPILFPFKDYKFILRDCIIYHPIKWRNQHFGHLDFSETIFHENVDFSGAIFHEEVFLKKVIFKKHADFKGCSLLAKSEFRINCNTVDFQGAIFFSDCIFEVNKIENVKNIAQEEVRLVDINFLDIIIETKRKVTLLGTLANCAFSPRGEGILEFTAHSRLKNASFMDSNLRKCVFDSVDLSESLFLGAQISETRFFDCKFNEERYFLGGKRILLFDELYRRNGEKYYAKKGYLGWFNFVIKRRSHIFNALKETYCAFKNNYENNKDYVTADKFHCSEMEMKQALVLETIKDRNIRETNSDAKMMFFYMLYRLKNDIFSFYRWYQYLSGYGTNYIRPLILILIVLFCFSVSFMFSGLPDIQYELGQQGNLLNVTRDFIESLFYTAAILIPGSMKYYFTEGLPSLTKKISVIELVVMWTLIPLFILALKRHFKR